MKAADLPSNESPDAAERARLGLRRRWALRIPRFSAPSEAVVIGLLSVALFLAAWQMVSSFGLVAPRFLPGPASIARALVDYVRGPQFPTDISTTSTEFALGYGISIGIGVLGGLVLGWYRRPRYFCDMVITVLYSTPRIAFIPLLIIWFGVGIWPKVAIVVLEAALAILITVMRGVMSLEPEVLVMARSFTGSDTQLLRTIGLPGSVPHILTGLRLGTSYAIVGVVVGEFVESQHGLGTTMLLAGNLGDVATVMAILILFACAGLSLRLSLQLVERAFSAWRL
jgi:NitT/TauT family transport system permease protein